ncbi:MAG TPA: aldehyde ferredoxin oxidoreductase N-terminal domain-containing protein [Anaerolineales bacterium]|nr:aldehyde ferredoxin oxidoreductase N-terminal domain-containing protein [Anaerolineales bacterium]
MTYPIIQRELTVHLHNKNWYLRPIEDEEKILGPVDYGWHRFNLYPDSFTFGEGLLAGSSIPGSRRLVFCSWSSQWDGFYVSSMGGAAYTFHGVGVNYVALRGMAYEPSVVLLNHRAGEVQVRIEPVNVDPLWAGYASPDGRPLIGFYALQQALLDRYKDEYTKGNLRICAVGPAAKYTREGAIGSSPVRAGAFTAVVDWAGRGGLGSRLFQRHNIVGIVFGGEWDDPDLRDSAEIDSYFLEHFGKKTIQADMSVTEKYRYVPEFETGGTFGVNMRDLNERILSFNYTSIYQPVDSRLRQHENFILEHYLKQFNEETIRTKKFQHCGEPCPVVCKKMYGPYKKDYEPYHVLGPQVGVFDQRAAEVLNDFVDAMGFDSIQSGGMVAWIMELVRDGLIDPVEFGLPPADEMCFDWVDDSSRFDVVADSMRNAQYAMSVVRAILFEPKADVFRKSIRVAARELDKRYGIRSIDRAVFISHGDEGCMVPNQYWVPGMLSPMPMMGKYFVHYGVEFMSPEALGRKNVERMTYELFSENSGICRFHRKWSETITDEILRAHYQGLDADYKAHQFQLAREIFEREAPKIGYWESERVIDMVLGYLQQWESDGLRTPELMDWLKRFHEDKHGAAKAYWQAVFDGIRSAFRAGPQAIPDSPTPGQQKQQQNVSP